MIQRHAHTTHTHTHTHTRTDRHRYIYTLYYKYLSHLVICKLMSCCACREVDLKGRVDCLEILAGVASLLSSSGDWVVDTPVDVVACWAAWRVEQSWKWLFIRTTRPTIVFLHNLHSARVLPFGNMTSLNFRQISSFCRGISIKSERKKNACSVITKTITNNRRH